MEGGRRASRDGPCEGVMAEREWFEKDFYKVLGVSETASDKDITRAYRKLAKELHPDTNPGSEERFKEVTAAYDVVGDAEKRKEYDEVRRLGPMAGGPGGFGGAPFGDYGDIGDILGGLFGRTGRQSRSRRGDDLETSLTLNFRDSIFGVTTTVSLPSTDNCTICRGTGASPGTSMVTCGTCNGRGVLADDQGPFGISRTCPSCHGRGGRLERPCGACGGSGREASSRKVQVRLPAGVEDGQRIRVKGKGGAGLNGGPPGDLYVDVRVIPDVRFSRRGRHVTTTASIGVTDAILGTTVSVPTLDDVVTLKISPGTQPGTTLRVKGRGVPSHGKHATGDLLVTVAVHVPSDLTDEQRKLVEKLDESFGSKDSE